MSDSPNPPLLDADYLESLLLLAEGDPSILESVYDPLLNEALQVADQLARNAPAALEELFEAAEVLKAPGLAAIATALINDHRADGVEAIRAEVQAIRQALLGIKRRILGQATKLRRN